MCLRIASSNGGMTRCNVDVLLVWHVVDLPVGWHDDDYSSSELDNSVGEAEMMLNASNKIGSPSDCLDELTDASDMMHEPSGCSAELSEEGDDMYCEPSEGSERGSAVSQPSNDIVQPEVVQMACVRE